MSRSPHVAKQYREVYMRLVNVTRQRFIQLYSKVEFTT